MSGNSLGEWLTALAGLVVICWVIGEIDPPLIVSCCMGWVGGTLLAILIPRGAE